MLLGMSLALLVMMSLLRSGMMLEPNLPLSDLLFQWIHFLVKTFLLFGFLSFPILLLWLLSCQCLSLVFFAQWYCFHQCLLCCLIDQFLPDSQFLLHLGKVPLLVFLGHYVSFYNGYLLVPVNSPDSGEFTGTFTIPYLNNEYTNQTHSLHNCILQNIAVTLVCQKKCTSRIC